MNEELKKAIEDIDNFEGLTKGRKMELMKKNLSQKMDRNNKKIDQLEKRKETRKKKVEKLELKLT